ncbi:PREDICTED: uncharacterized protein LOC104595803 [Nelumbo nucifera]|uniref:Uncharacterized protein LOC104595803 n=2 Tax=Nelumbo nucifera TaxID=4432 RepID=A0A1U7ZSH7_NELNU|nr:PREDICTED: uncharacterized protein LOC104595803 [Nelumbo nucifera]DAD40605.1 TPA_asm: hypothetical protein HUJ06_014928 [Nelumbo nucifera]
MKYGEISHLSHPQHKLRFEYAEAPFKCDGCKEAGIGSRYKCNVCDFDLHMHCALPSPSISHPFYTKCSFQFLPRPPGDMPRFCNACEKDVNGFVYHCKSCGFDLHPTCANLPRVIEDGEVKLYLYRKLSSACHKCGRKGRSWSYRSSCKKYNLHVACAKEILLESWHDIYFGRGNSNKKLQTRIPSLKATFHNHHLTRGGKVKKCCEMAGMGIQFIISAILGDPTSLIAGVIGSLMSKS